MDSSRPEGSAPLFGGRGEASVPLEVAHSIATSAVDQNAWLAFLFAIRSGYFGQQQPNKPLQQTGPLSPRVRERHTKVEGRASTRVAKGPAAERQNR